MDIMLKKVEVILQWPLYAEKFIPLVMQCREKGITMHFTELVEFDYEKWYEMQSGQESIQDIHVGEHLPTLTGHLVITDSPSCVNHFIEKEIQVLAYSHNDNKALSFSNVKYIMENPEELDVRYLDRITRRFANEPWPILETERCILRETTEEDVPAFFRIYQDKSITEYMEDLYPTPEEEIEYTRKYRQYMYEFYEHGVWTVLHKESGEVIGRAGITIRDGYELPEIAFMIAVPYQGKGYATEVIRGILDYGREEFGYEEYIAFVHPENAKSKHLLEKFRFTIQEEKMHDLATNVEYCIYRYKM